MPSICCKAASSILLASDLLTGFGRVAGGEVAKVDAASVTSMFTMTSYAPLFARPQQPITELYWQMFATHTPKNQQQTIQYCRVLPHTPRICLSVDIQ